MQCGRLWRWHDGFRWFHRAGRSDIWKTLSFILALMDSIKMVSRSRTYRKTSQILHRWCRWGAGEKGLSVDTLPGVLSVDDLKGKLRKPCNILCWKNWLLHIRVTLELNSILRSQELQCWGNIKYILELDSIPKNPELQCWGNWALIAACCDCILLALMSQKGIRLCGDWGSSWLGSIFKGLALVV